MTKISIITIMLLGILGFSNLNHPPKDVIKSEKLTFTVDTVVSGLKVPWGLAFLPNGDMLIADRSGELRLFQNGKLHPDPIKGLPEVRAKGQGGLFDLELHPNYEENGWIYMSFASPAKKDEEGEGANTEFVRAKLKNHELVNVESLFKASPNYKKNNHFGGRIEFDNDGYLYLSIGDRQGRDENQTVNNYRGKVFRLNDDGSIPKDNPFVGQKDAKPETFSYGHRNPQGLAMNPVTGDIWEHEHGPKGGDEINIIRKGHNYGWPAITYGINYSGTIITKDTVREGMDQPVTFWRPSIAPCGMDFVTSDKYENWKNNLLVGSLRFRYIKRVEIENDEVVHQETLLDGIGRVRVIREAPDGYIYVGVEGPGMVIRLVPEEG